MTTSVIDIHTHVQPGVPGLALISLEPGNLEFQPGQWYSVGLHPWNESVQDEHTLNRMESLLSNPQVLAVGECGLDRLHGPDFELQKLLFTRQVELSERLRLPLIIHDVHSTDTILQIHKSLKPAQKWLIHGFRGGPQLLQQIADHGILVSFGLKFNPDSIRMVSLDRLFLETDGKTDIDKVIALASAHLGVPIHEIEEHVIRNNKDFLDYSCMVQLSGLNLQSF